MAEPPHITICICTFRRTEMLLRLLQSLRQQETDGLFTFSVIVADNDAQESARPIVSLWVPQLNLPVVYCVEPRRNIAMARNCALRNAQGQLVVFIDDDEFPASRWLINLYLTYQVTGAAGVLGPVRPHFGQQPPKWLIKGGFFERPCHLTGARLSWQECRTGNVLISREVIDEMNPAFRSEFGTGGEDQDFFRRAIDQGNTFVWCDEAVVYEVVPPQRWQRSVLIKRALLRGKNSLKHPERRWLNVAKAAVAVPLYAAALPLLLLAGQHLFMKYLVKLCDHTGRLLGLLGINPIRERSM